MINSESVKNVFSRIYSTRGFFKMKLMLLVIIGLPLSGFAKGPNFPLRNSDLPGIELLISIQELQKNVTSHEQWHNIHVQIEYYKDQFFSDKLSIKERCDALGAIETAQLLDFYDEVMFTQSSRLGYCNDRLQRKISNYLSVQSDYLEQNYKGIAEKNLRKCSDRSSKTFGPEIVASVDPKKVRQIIGDQHSHCQITFTFDDGPHVRLTPQLLKILKSENLKVNFFVVGEMVNYHPQILQETFSRGHVIGNHTQQHLDLRKLSFASAKAEIINGFNSILKAIGIEDSSSRFPFFRFPYGAGNRQTREFLGQLDSVEFLWNIDSNDWAIKDPKELYTYAIRQIDNAQGGVVLFHDIQPQTIAAIPYIFKALTESGYYPLLIEPQSN